MGIQVLKRQKAHQHLSDVVLDLVHQRHCLAASRANLRLLRYCPCSHLVKTYQRQASLVHFHRQIP